jgi:hypothetical protein
MSITHNTHYLNKILLQNKTVTKFENEVYLSETVTVQTTKHKMILLSTSELQCLFLKTCNLVYKIFQTISTASWVWNTFGLGNFTRRKATFRFSLEFLKCEPGGIRTLDTLLKRQLL